ncbi:MAG: glutamine synthetase III [Christensenellaceae bacterium]|jgi:glutamine synthetase
MYELSKEFGSMVFNDETMRSRLPKDTYKALKKTMEDGLDLDISVANVVASAMKDWAIEHGVTHYTHWFQPMTGITAEKHDSFISPTEDGRIIMVFSGKELIKGEPDASSFPSGGLRATFEARGYTAWDPTSFAFIKDNVLCIPTAFCSYGGEALDKKTPLLRSMEALDNQATRILRALGKETKHVRSTVGPEQEYFLIDKSVYEKRRDLMYCHRTLFGAPPPKGQELNDHYFGSIKPRVAAFMEDLDKELWKLGVLAKTKHNEVAPAQHELAPVYTTANIASDHNQLTMELMRKVANRHGMECLLHEKPFAGINGSGKHCNWSMSTDSGENLLEPTSAPQDNLQFLLFLSAAIAAVDKHQDLLRLSVASAGNDHRLGGSEAPPAIISIYLGDDLAQILECIEMGTEYNACVNTKRRMDTGVNALPNFKKDTTDRNRTSPFAFTGNKFEFRMPGSSLSVSGPVIIINTIVADMLEQFANELENASDKDTCIRKLIKETMQEHKRIIFNGNNYSDEWVAEAERRGLLNLPSTADALPFFVKENNIQLFEKHKVFSKAEIYSRCEILLDEYCKMLNIEAITMLQMSKKSIIPAVTEYTQQLAESSFVKKQLGDVDTTAEDSLVKELSSLLTSFMKAIDTLDNALGSAKACIDPEECAKYYRSNVFTAMQELRSISDSMEVKVSKKIWPWPTYGDILFSVS